MAIAIESRLAPPQILGLPEPWFHLVAGSVLAPVLSLTPLLSLIGWYLAALVHEMGHTAAAWLVGVPAIPALGITAEAATVHGDQILPLAAFVWLASGWALWRIEREPLRWSLLAVLMVSYPVIAFGPARELVHLTSGHLFELAIGGVFIGRALSNGFTHSQAERVLYATLGWFLLGRNLVLTIGLATSASARAEYATSGSFGTVNDYIRLASELGWSLEVVAVLMSMLALCVAPAVIGLWCWATPSRERQLRPRRRKSRQFEVARRTS